MAAAVVVGGVGAHAGAGNTILAEADPGGHAALFEAAVLFIQVELVGLSVIGDDNVGPAVFVVIQNRDSEAFRSWISQASFLRRVFKAAIAEVVPEAHRGAFVGLGGAIGFVCAIDSTVKIALLAPLHVIGDYQVEFAVAIVVEPGRAG